jgi:hypothetical protein
MFDLGSHPGEYGCAIRMPSLRRYGVDRQAAFDYRKEQLG